MLPSDHFVKFYNEIFKYLERKGPEELDRYYERVAERQAFFTLDAFKRDGFKGMYDYWERIRIEENCDLAEKAENADFAVFMPYLGDYYNVTGGWATQRTEWWNLLQRVFAGGDVATEVGVYTTNANASIVK